MTETKPKISELSAAVDKALDDVQAKKEALDKATDAQQKASEAYNKSVDAAMALRNTYDEEVNKILPTFPSRVRQSG